MNLITRVTNIFRMLLAFRACGLINAWRMALQTNEIIRLAVAVPYPIDESEAEQQP